MKNKLTKFWEWIKDTVSEAAIWFNASHDIEEGKDPRESFQHSKTLNDVPDEIKKPR